MRLWLLSSNVFLNAHALQILNMELKLSQALVSGRAADESEELQFLFFEDQELKLDEQRDKEENKQPQQNVKLCYEPGSQYCTFCMTTLMREGHVAGESCNFRFCGKYDRQICESIIKVKSEEYENKEPEKDKAK
ncbi:uncharacterized protein LOC133393981 [Anopheles gambiae]|uniref:uncharacterized protein LOC133393844 n=1 Tax=Anopheles gambiae TaxID=7165 RepID=UPI002AC8B413|nr:uncharacterized protein LOC133393844 [Anopheles gambiae]XP_061517681.1 uncharacterized protein LOC133393981 [Anopheles gambiae]